MPWTDPEKRRAYEQKRKKSPEYQEKQRESKRRFRDRKRSDPELRAEYNAKARATYAKASDARKAALFARSVAWQKANPEKHKSAVRRSRIKRAYGLSQADYDTLLEEQKGRCAVCNALPKADEYLCVDHCHTTKRVRGLLCHACNHGLGKFRDDPNLLRNAIDYLDLYRAPPIVRTTR